MTNVSFRIFLFILAFAPLAFGTVEHWSLMTVEILTVVALLFCIGGLKISSESLYRIPGLFPLILLLGLMMFQLVPLPPGLVRVLSPASWQAYEPVYRLSGADFWIPVSVNQKATLQELLRICSYGLFYLLTVQVLRTGARIYQTLKFIALLGAVIAFIAILQQFSSNGLIYWFRAAPGGHPGGPWININQYAAFIEAVCPIVLALFLYYRPVNPDDENWRERFVSFFSSPQSNVHLFMGFAFILMVFSVFVTLCRGGIITILASMVLFGMLSSLKRGKFGKSAFWIVICLALLAVSWFGWQPVFNEFDRAFDPSGAIRDGRLQLWSDTAELIQDHIFVGGGFGTFNDIYPSYKTIASNLAFEHAHNDYLELLANGGIIGFILAAWFCCAVLSHGLRKMMVRRDRLAVLVGVGSITSICALLMHSVVDFNMHNGAVGLYFFFICGLLVAVVNHRYTRYEETSLLSEMKPVRGAALFAFSGLFLALVLAVQVSVLIAANSYTKIKHIYVTRHLDPKLVQEVEARLQTSQTFDPLEGRYPFNLGNVLLVGHNLNEAFDAYLDASRKQPMHGIYLQRLGMMLPEPKGEEAASLMREGYKRALNKEHLTHSWAEWLLLTAQRTQAVEVLRARLKVDPAQFVQMIPMLQINEFTREEIQRVLPSSPDGWIRYGDYLEKTGNIEESLYYRQKALAYIDYEPELKVGWIVQLIHFYRRHKQQEQALEIIRFGIEKIPEYAPFHIWLGDYYKKAGVTYRAKEEYEQAVMLAPENDAYRRKLQKLELDIEFGE